MSLTINKDSDILKEHTFQKGDLILIAHSNVIGVAIYESAASENKIYYHYIGSSFWKNIYTPKHPSNGKPSWLYEKINNPGVGALDFTNTHADKRVFPLPLEMCTKHLLEIQRDYKKARNLI